MSHHSHDHATEGNPALNKAKAFILGLVGFLLFGIFTAVFIVRSNSSLPTEDEKRAEERLQILQKSHDADAEIINCYGWVDQSKKIVRIPISLAMQLTVRDLQAKPIAPAYPVPGMAVPTPTGCATTTTGPATGSPVPTLTSPAPAGKVK